jgi:hypothetical protein
MSVASIERRRTLARALHEPSERYAPLHATIETYRERARAMVRRLAELEAAGNDNVGPLRRALLACTEQVESVARLIGAPPGPPPADSLDWLDAPTIPRKRR